VQTIIRRCAKVLVGIGVCGVLVATLASVSFIASDARAGGPWRFGSAKKANDCPPGNGDETTEFSNIGGNWFWMRNPDEEKRRVMGLYNRYCIRCHGVDGRGIWDIPDVPNFTNARWQESRSDAHLARIIIEGRGAVMPPFRGAITLEESWAIGRYLRTLVPGTEVSRPILGQPEKSSDGSKSAK
jgi:mono/diheme cytochrome c family protein